jgi:molybdopterin synthase sulfur carrier subunit
MPDSRTSTITVQLVYLARLREAFGRTGEALTLPGADCSIAALLRVLREREGSFGLELAAGRAVRVAVNHALVGTDAMLRDGDEVALFPPVTGG